jgi:SNF2 family DNA or RNA helicase
MKIVQDKYLVVPQKLPIGLPKLHKGKEFTVLPWDLRTYRCLHKLNIPDIPNIMAGYDWAKAPYKPYAHQEITTQLLVAHKKAYCWNDTGTGKTASCLWAIDWLRKQGEIKKVLIVCPLSTTKCVWGCEWFSILPSVKYELLLGSREKRKQLMWKNPDCFIINHDGVKILCSELKKWKPDLVIVDEATAFKTHTTERWKMLNEITIKAPYVWLLTGTPFPQSPTDIYGQMRLIQPDVAGKSFNRFRDKLMIQVSAWKWVPRENCERIIMAMITPVIRFKRDECLDLPDVITQIYDIKLNLQQAAVYNKLKRDAMAQLEEGLITAVNEGVMRSKLLQCCGGFIYGEKEGEREVIDLKPAERFTAVKEIIEECARGVIIFSSFRHSIHKLHESMRAYSEVITGDTPLNRRTELFKRFQEGKLKVLIAHPRTMGHGVSLPYADTIIWYIACSDNELYEQANGRINRIGQKHKMRIIHFVGTDLERAVLKRLEQRRSLQGVLLETLGGKK